MSTRNFEEKINMITEERLNIIRDNFGEYRRSETE
jgi:hypothetical protein